MICAQVGDEVMEWASYTQTSGSSTLRHNQPMVTLNRGGFELKR